MARNYSNLSPELELVSGVNGVVTSFVVNADPVVAAPFTLVVTPDATKAAEEVVLVTNVVDNGNGTWTLTVERGYDGYSGKPHSAGADLIHAVIAKDLADLWDEVENNLLRSGDAVTVSSVAVSVSSGVATVLLNNTRSDLADNEESHAIVGDLASGYAGKVGFFVEGTGEQYGGVSIFGYDGTYKRGIRVFRDGDVQVGPSGQVHFNISGGAIDFGSLTLASGATTISGAYSNTSDVALMLSAAIPGINWRTTGSFGRSSILTNYAANNSISWLVASGASNPSLYAYHVDFSSGVKAGINTNSPDGTLHVHTGSAGSISASGLANEGVFENSSDGGISVLTPDASTAYIAAGSPGQALGAFLSWNYNAGIASFGANKSGASLILKSGANTIALTLDGNQRGILASLLGTGGNTPTAYLDAAASTTSAASLRVRQGTAPASPNGGDIWQDGTNIYIRLNGTTYTFDLTAV